MKTEIISSIFSHHNSEKLESNYKKKTGKNYKYVEIKQHTSEQLLCQQGNQRKDKESMERNENENTTYQTLWRAKAVVRRKFVAMQAYPKKQEEYQINNLTYT